MVPAPQLFLMLVIPLCDQYVDLWVIVITVKLEPLVDLSYVQEPQEELPQDSLTTTMVRSTRDIPLFISFVSITF